MIPNVKYPYVGSIRWAFFRWADIESAAYPGKVYLRRLRLVQCPLFAIYVHWIYQRDDDQDPHNHPMNFWSLILKGGYIEHRWAGGFLGTRQRRRWSAAHTTMDTYHRIVALFERPTVTLLLVGKRSKSWGFLLPDGTHVDYREYKRS